MLDHHLQRSIVYKLALSEAQRFSELKPATIENKLFDYHLKKVVASGLVEKSEAGLYHLTAQGRRLGLRALEANQTVGERAESVLFLVINHDDSWLLYRRLSHPLKGKTGFMHAMPVPHELVADTATRECLLRTGLNCIFTSRGSGYFRVYRRGELESFTHFTLLVANSVSGELIQNDEFAEYSWVDSPDFSAAEMLPNMAVLSQQYSTGDVFFVEKTFQLS